MKKNVAIIATSIVAVLLVVFLGLVSFHHNKKRPGGFNSQVW